MLEDKILDAPLIEGAIRNPNNFNHFMVAKPVNRRIRVFARDVMLAVTTKAFRLVEIGKSVYDPILYIPTEDLTVLLERLDKTTHCPLKGDASYYAYAGNEISWSYLEPFHFANQIKGYHAFWASKIRIEEGE